jgi:MFS family permease
MATKKKTAKKSPKKRPARAVKKATKRKPTRSVPRHEHTFLESEAAVAGVAITEPKKEPIFSSTQWTVLLILAFIQFMHIVDFMVIMPLARKLEVEFHISTNQFGWLVSSYTFAAFFSGIAGSFFIDRVSRKASLLIGSAGFIAGNFFCAVAPGFWQFLAARVVTGAFGGLLNGVTFSIIGDLIEPQKRGRATDVIMMAFSVAAVAGCDGGLIHYCRSTRAADSKLPVGRSFWYILQHRRDRGSKYV